MMASLMLRAATDTPDRAVTYRKVAELELKVHIFEPENYKPSDRRPAIIFFFGGGWVTGDATPISPPSGPIRIFPAVSAEWKDIEFRDLRTEGAFLVSASRRNGVTEWVRIKSLAGERCRVKVDLRNPQVQGGRSHILKQLTTSMFELDLRKNEEVLMSEMAQ